MKPPAFDYFAPGSVDEALALLAERGAEAKALAGGQSLVQLLNMRLLHPRALVDLNRIPDLAYLRREGETLVVGAMTRQQQAATSDELRASAPLLYEAVNLTAFPAVRSRGTIGGSVANAEPGAQIPLALAMLDGGATVARSGGERAIDAARLFSGERATSLAPDELLIDLRFPVAPADATFAMREYRRGYSGPPLLTASAMLVLGDDGAIRSARLGLHGAEDVPSRLTDQEASLFGVAASDTDEAFQTVAEQAARRVVRADAVLADLPLRRRIARTLLLQVLDDCLRRAAARRPLREVG
jgi:CO/xanthine dehydrogenase FAD-binding subunit